MNIFTYFTPFSDGPSPWGIYLQDSASPQMEALIELHDNIMFYLVIILFGAGWILASIVRNYVSDKSPMSNKCVNHDTLTQWIWTITSALILILIGFPSFKLLYLMDEFTDPSLTVFSEGDQSYWSYEECDLTLFTVPGEGSQPSGASLTGNSQPSGSGTNPQPSGSGGSNPEDGNLYYSRDYEKKVAKEFNQIRSKMTQTHEFLRDKMVDLRRELNQRDTSTDIYDKIYRDWCADNIWNECDKLRETGYKRVLELKAKNSHYMRQGFPHERRTKAMNRTPLEWIFRSIGEYENLSEQHRHPLRYVSRMTYDECIPTDLEPITPMTFPLRDR